MNLILIRELMFNVALKIHQTTYQIQCEVINITKHIVVYIFHVIINGMQFIFKPNYN